MKSDALVLSQEFQTLYCDPSVFEEFSGLHPISFKHVLPFQAHDLRIDSPHLLAAEARHLASPTDATAADVLDAFGNAGLLPPTEVTNVKPIVDFFGSEFFEFMGEVYANAGMFICALRWYREFIAELETRRPGSSSDSADVYASVGYCLYSLGLFPEAISWSKSCIGPRQVAETVNRVLIEYEAHPQGGCIQTVERALHRTRYTVVANDAGAAGHLSPRIKDALNTFAPFQEVYIDWIGVDGTTPPVESEGYPFGPERDASPMMRHRMNLLFALCSQADALTAMGCDGEAKRCLAEALMLEPQAEFIRNRFETLGQC